MARCAVRVRVRVDPAAARCEGGLQEEGENRRDGGDWSPGASAVAVALTEKGWGAAAAAAVWQRR